MAAWRRISSAALVSLNLIIGTGFGTKLYGIIDKNAVSDPLCPNRFDWRYDTLWVGAFALCLVLLNQARWRHAPFIVCIALVGYVVNYLSAPLFVTEPGFAYILSGFTIGLLGSLYSRARNGLSFAAMLPAILVQAPGAQAAIGSLLAILQGGADPTSTPTSEAMLFYYFWFSMVPLATGTALGVMFSQWGQMKTRAARRT